MKLFENDLKYMHTYLYMGYSDDKRNPKIYSFTKNGFKINGTNTGLNKLRSIYASDLFFVFRPSKLK